MININIPEVDLSFSCDQYHEYIEQLKKKSGIYLFYDDNELLYIGKTVNLYSRLIGHINGSSNLKDVKHNFKRVEVIFINDVVGREIYETYMINTLKPLLNVDKVFTYTSSRYEDKYNPKHTIENKIMWNKIDKELESFVL
jgi:excinuclease UvrABC nuclease subunit